MNKGIILAVDDMSDSLRLITEVLGKEGFQVRPADSGELAIASASASPPDLILLDIRMPGMDGFAVCRRLKVLPETRNIPVIFLSATNDIDERIEGLRLGAVDFVSKPFRSEELIARVRNHVELGRMRNQLEKAVTDRTAEARLAAQSLDLPLKQAADAQDWALVARLFEPSAILLLMHNPALRAWFIDLPPTAAESEPMIGFWQAFALAGIGRISDADNAAAALEASLKPDDTKQLARVLAIRGKITEIRGDGANAVRMIKEAIELSPEIPDPKLPNTALAQHWLGTAYCAAGLPVLAERRLREICTLTHSFEGPRRWLTPIVYSWYGRSLYMQGRLSDSMAVCRQAMSLAREYGGPAVNFIYALEADILYSRNLLDTARQSLEKSSDAQSALEQWFSVPTLRLTDIRLKYACGHSHQGDLVAEELVEWCRRNEATILRHRAEAIRADHWLREGKIERTLLWAKERGHTDEIEVTYARESTLMTMARLYLALSRQSADVELAERAIRLLGRIRESAAADNRTGDCLAALAVEALAVEQSGDVASAMTLLEECLTIAVPESYFRIFLDEGAPMEQLLREALSRGMLPVTVAGVAAMFDEQDQPAAVSLHKRSKSTTELNNPLTDREFELLSLIASGMTNADLAESLYISNNTVKTHVKHLFQKLNATSRTEAVARARSLGLLN